MNQTQYTVRCLEASEGYFITQAADVPDSQRMVGRHVILGINDSPDNYKEIPEIEARRILALQKLSEVSTPLPDIPEDPAEEPAPTE